MLRTLIFAATALLLSACNPYYAAVPRAELQDIRSDIQAYQQQLNRRFAAGELNYGQVARLRSAYTKRLMSQSEQWNFDSWDEEYHQFKILLADQIDAKKITVEQAKYMDIKKANEIKERAGRAGYNWTLMW